MTESVSEEHDSQLPKGGSSGIVEIFMKQVLGGLRDVAVFAGPVPQMFRRSAGS